MVFTEVDSTTLIFDLNLFLRTTRRIVEERFGTHDIESYVAAFSSELYHGGLHSHNVTRYESVSTLVYEKIVNGEIGLNADTRYSYEGASKVNAVLEDCLRAVSSNSRCIWATGKPIMDDESNLAVTVQLIRPQTMLKRWLRIQPTVIDDTTFESGRASHISGTCRGFVVSVSGRQLEVGTEGFRWS